MASVGIMIEGQEGLTWERWRRICETADAMGFASLRRSDHVVSLMGDPQRDCIECWMSLALAAVWTKRIEFGPMVSPMTFRPPSVLARMATAVDQLSGGRLILGVGAGWNEAEHVDFGLPFPPQGARFDLLESGIRDIRSTWQRCRPTPVRTTIPILVGGKGAKRTLPLAAREAAEWNLSRLDTDMFRDLSGQLDAHCRELGRDPATLRRSVMTSYIIGRNQDDILARAAQLGAMIPALRDLSPGQVLQNRREAWFVGTPEQIAERMREFSRIGVEQFMLQHFLMDDHDALELLSKEVMPAIAF